jgi:hypothetical protein
MVLNGYLESQCKKRFERRGRKDRAENAEENQRKYL